MEDFKKELYSTALITAGATAVGLVSKKAVGTQLGTPETLKGALKLGVAKQKWYEKEVVRKNDIEAKRHQLSEANVDIKITNKALIELNHSASVSEERSKASEPKLDDYYEPSSEMEEYKLLTTAIVGLVSGLAGYEVYERFREK